MKLYSQVAENRPKRIEGPLGLPPPERREGTRESIMSRPGDSTRQLVGHAQK
jgi:hypothetical protein